ncbi:hypothetical protein INR75_18605 [Zunongwangia sp. SCSIO 43204]|uniref:hypothetical protein n=1 Tax=Zunongwangia sp. SCSIO 43204 TaxID=2779359 RepID=UPI001CA85375|nr:hypothetical protein [Zunongwangia sp. SCSIO 43204]UAB84149.1 hypothetical protein INR75_18605 [Zunongwangia sp. SCSIO 43204]
MYFKIYKQEDGFFRFEYKSDHGDFLFQGLGVFRSLDHCKKGIDYFKNESMYESFFSRETDSEGNPFFLMLDQTAKKLGISDIYSSFTLMERDIDVLKAQIYASPIDEEVASEE